MSYSVVRIDDEPNNPKLSEFILDYPSDAATLPTDVADGSSAWTRDLAHIYVFKSGTWAEAG